VGSNVVVIGGGNSAVDSARTAKRRSKGMVRILYRRTAEEMTAVREDVEEAVKEGVSIEYLTAPVEILGDGIKVAGIRCQRMALGEIEGDGRRRPVPIPGSEFVIDADNVVVAIGQRPNTSLLNIKRLDINGDDATIEVDPLTLETGIAGIFAGGDCVMGPNNVVDAMAAGLLAAESIDRYLRGRDLRKGRSLERPQPAEVDVKERDVSPHKRARMPVIHYFKRMGSFEETTLGLPSEMAEREAGRCLNCALCSECLECEQACALGAVHHRDRTEQVEIKAELIIDFASANGGPDTVPEYGLRGSTPVRFSKLGIHTVRAGGNGGMGGELGRASAAALEAAAELKLKEEGHLQCAGGASGLDVQPRPVAKSASGGEGRIGVVLCRCGGSLSVIDFSEVATEARQLLGVCSVQEVSQACSEEGARQIAAQAAEWELGRVVLAACRCCNLDQICFSCTDRRVMCQRYLGQGLPSPNGTAVEFVNIREQCAWVHADDPLGATRKAIRLVSSGVAQASEALPPAREQRSVEGSVLVLGASLCGLAAARDLAAQGYSVSIVSGPESKTAAGQHSPEYLDRRTSLLRQLQEQGIHIRPWPQALELHGSPGSYEAALRYRSQASRIKAGAVILDPAEVDGEAPPAVSAIPREGFLGRILARLHSSGVAGADSAALRGLTITETAGIFITSSDGAGSPEEEAIRGAAAAARASAYLGQGRLIPRATAVTIASKLCRGCGDCAAICPYIEMRNTASGMACAYVDQALCLGCGACIARCPTGAITQPVQSDQQLTSTLEALLGRANGGGDAQ
ncbi:FAD-dependent oxidoreductase, partial [Chloroflexota bacterium]